MALTGRESYQSNNSSNGSSFNNFVSVKAEPIEFNEDLNLCRCCFKILNSWEAQYPISDDLAKTFQDLMQLVLKPCYQAPSFCETCYNEILSYDHFKKITIAKQQKFEEVQEKGGDLSEIYKSNLIPETFPEMPRDTRDDTDRPDVFHNFLVPKIAYDFPSSQDELKVPKSSQPLFNYPLSSSSKSTPKRKSDGGDEKLCPICGKNFKNVVRHIGMIHEKIKRFSCDLCGYAVYEKSNLLKHMHRKHTEECYYCSMCSFKTAILTSLTTHVTNQHGEARERTEKCQDCNKEFLSKHGLINHIKRYHEKVKAAKCELCDIGFFDKQALK